MKKQSIWFVSVIAIIVVLGFFYYQGTFNAQTAEWISPPVSISAPSSTKPTGEIAAPAPTVVITQVAIPSTQEAKDLFALTNAVRQVPLEYSSVLESLAQQRAAYLCSHTFSHDGYRMFIDQSGYSYVGENLARGFADTQSMFDVFMASPTHKANILRAQYTDTGIAEACGVTVVFFGGKSN